MAHNLWERFFESSFLFSSGKSRAKVFFAQFGAEQLDPIRPEEHFFILSFFSEDKSGGPKSLSVDSFLCDIDQPLNMFSTILFSQ